MSLMVSGALIFFIVNGLLSYLQMNDLRHSIQSMKKRQETCVVTIGKAKSGYSFKKGAIIIVALSEQNRVLDFHELVGRTVFSRTKQVSQLVGCSIQEVHEYLSNAKDFRKKAFEDALKNANRALI
ncbi:hypothetical protein NRIC_35920 [Enterococcus florum]|uniref:Transcriptional regulator n=1 Tax=Enterococcus florum TaxID=2480627 RepID=A0A4P5PGZ8_9ENTE|nr:transcriptional regulator GutM [Enterococcus florum]GCF95701.1 hypothetical protein NRIC_35920 [Enterococcus florum]